MKDGREFPLCETQGCPKGGGASPDSRRGKELGREDPHYFNRFPTEVQNAAQNVRIPAEPILENSG
jgi:hypothetical protein